MVFRVWMHVVLVDSAGGVDFSWYLFGISILETS